MPIYDVRCAAGHTTEIVRRMAERDAPATCGVCGEPATRIISRPAGSPDGIYSYAPNIGDPDRFERQRQAIKDGVKVIPRERPRHYDPERGY